MVTLTPGTVAPPFILDDARGGQVALQDALAHSRVALLFYRGGWCPLCCRQLADWSARHDEFRERSLEVLAISNEPVTKGRALLHKIGPPYPLLLDTGGSVIAAYGLAVATRDPLGWFMRKQAYAQATVVLIGQDGLIQWMYRGASYRDRPSIDLVLRAADESVRPTHD